jgi:hypothetical protein
MAEHMFTTGGPTRLPVFFLSAVLFTAVFAACSGKAESSESHKSSQANGNVPATESTTSAGEQAVAFGEGEDFAEAGDLLWDTPDLPAGIALEINGVEVDYFVVEGFLLPKWSGYASLLPLETPVEQLTQEYFANPEEVFYELVRGVVLLREAEARFPVLDEHELQLYKERMEGAAGTAKDSLIARYGAAGWAAHVERKFRLHLILNEYQKYAPELTEEELYAFYDSEILANLPEPEKREHIDISFQSMEPALRANLMKGRAIDAQEAWLDGEIIGVKVKATLPAGLSKSWTITELP